MQGRVNHLTTWVLGLWLLDSGRGRRSNSVLNWGLRLPVLMGHALMAVMVGLGEVLWDLFADKRLLGGAPANFAFHARQLGHEGIVVSRVGDDDLGREILDRLSKSGLSTEYVQVDRNHPTGTVRVTVGADGAPQFIITQDVAWDYLQVTDRLADLIGRADVVSFGTLAQRSPLSGETIQRLLAQCRGMKVFDINLRQRYWSPEQIESGLRQSQVAKLNEDELAMIVESRLASRSSDAVETCRALVAEYGLSLVALTRASRGALLVTDNEIVDQPGFRVQVVDGVGAGDAFTAALADAMLRHMSLTEVAARANRIGAYVASQSGATPPLPRELLAE